MNYYILPKINNTVIVNPIDSSYNNLHSYSSISQSLSKYHTESNKQIKSICENDTDQNLSYEDLIKIVNPYEYIFTKVPGSKFSVSKLKPKTNLFYDFLEICSIVNIFEPYKLQTMKTLHVTHNHSDTVECLEMLRENYTDEITSFNEINDGTVKLIGDEKYNFLFFETKKGDINQYIYSFIEILMIILRNQANKGSCIIKISEVFHKPVVDILYILSSLYERTLVLKPNTNNITTFDKYIVCKNFKTREKNTNFKLNYIRLFVFIKKLEGKQIVSLLDYDIPYYYMLKIDDMNIISGQQQLESLDLIINILKNKNKEEKIETIKKTNIHKSVSWCEKHKIPCNKFTEKINIFLPVNKEIKLLDLGREMRREIDIDMSIDMAMDMNMAMDMEINNNIVPEMVSATDYELNYSESIL
jgi:hypothetical protein